MALTVDGKNRLLLRYVENETLFIDLMTDDGDGGPLTAEERKSLTFGSPSNGKIDITSNIVFDVDAGRVAKKIIFGAIVSDILFPYGEVNITNETFVTAGTYTLTKFEITLT